MSNTLMTLAAFATGLASVAAIAGYHLLLPSPGVAFASGGSAVDAKKSEPPSNPSIKTLADTLQRPRHRHQIIDTLPRLDDHRWRDVGLTRGIMASIKSANGRPRGVYTDMTGARVNRF